jgi:type II secretory pathway pseudopilin PulG
MCRHERGFSLVEVVIAGAVGVFILLAVLSTANTFISGAARTNARLESQAAADRLVERVATEASGAWAVFVPANDVAGRSNADGHELDLFSEDGAHRTYAWAYLYDAQTKFVTRYVCAPGTAAVATETLGPFDAFEADPADVTGLAKPSSIIYDPLFAGATAPVVHYAYAAMPSAIGGNAIVRLHLLASGVDRAEMLAGANAPTTFTVVIRYTPSPVAPTPTPAPLPTWSWTPPPS